MITTDPVRSTMIIVDDNKRFIVPDLNSFTYVPRDVSVVTLCDWSGTFRKKRVVFVIPINYFELLLLLSLLNEKSS